MLQLWSLSHLVSHSLITPLGVSHLILHPSWILYDDANYHSPVSNGVHPHDLWIFAIVIWWMHKEPLLMQPACPVPCLPDLFWAIGRRRGEYGGWWGRLDGWPLRSRAAKTTRYELSINEEEPGGGAIKGFQTIKS